MLKRSIAPVAALLLFIAVMLGSALTAPAPSAVAQQPQRTPIYFFWGDGCPHCENAKPFLAGLAERYPGVVVRDYEVWYVEANREPMLQMGRKFGFEISGVPAIFIGTRYWIGFSNEIGAEMEAYVKTCMATGCPDAGAGILPPLPGDEPAPVETPAPAGATDPTVGESRTISLPLIGTVDLATQSLVVSTLLIAFVDGVNPCSVWVLTILLSITLHTGSRRKVFFIGLIFITVTAAIYALFIAGLFTAFTVISFVGWIQVLVALVALFFAAVNIKDYFWYKEGVSFTISEKEKPGIYQRMRKVMDASDSPLALAGATVVLAAGVSLVEFSCTAGFPVLWTNLLVAQQVAPVTFIALLLLYMLVYQLDELGIFAIAVVTLKSNKLEEKHGRILKLIGGMLMLTLAIVMLVNPHLLSDLSNSLLIFALAFSATGLVLLLHRVVLPRMGVRIGSEQIKTTSQRQAAKSKREGVKSSKPAAKQKRSDGK